MKKRVLILEFRQETNSFNPIVMPMSAFNVGGASVGEEVFAACIRDKGAVAGAVEAFKEADIECIPSVFLAASPAGGRVADDVFAHLMEQVDAFAKSCEFDAIYASLHGATCTESYDDACGTLLAHLRELAGDKPITASF
ncbi:MAG: M81 family metallopeptidase, partial [Clostridia bacterium]|nr:M81 family metallopeptidase [Clostridia bacterium]